jgi:hypothetical protein
MYHDFTSYLRSWTGKQNTEQKFEEAKSSFVEAGNQLQSAGTQVLEVGKNIAGAAFQAYSSCSFYKIVAGEVVAAKAVNPIFSYFAPKAPVTFATVALDVSFKCITTYPSVSLGIVVAAGFCLYPETIKNTISYSYKAIEDTAKVFYHGLSGVASYAQGAAEIAIKTCEQIENALMPIQVIDDSYSACELKIAGESQYSFISPFSHPFLDIVVA